MSGTSYREIATAISTERAICGDESRRSNLLRCLILCLTGTAVAASPVLSTTLLSMNNFIVAN